MFFPYMYGGYVDSKWLIIMIGVLVLSLIAQHGVNSAFQKYNKVPAQKGLTAAEAAWRILNDAGVYDVSVNKVSGTLTDHYDPKTRVLNLSAAVFDSGSIAALGIAAHEAGHAIQHAEGYGPLAARNAIFPATRFASNLAVPLVIIGFLLSFGVLIYVGIAFYAVAVLFQLITLPVEFNASNQAIALLERGGYLTFDEIPACRKVLNAAAVTYLVAALASILQLIRLVSMTNRRR